jgi:hypothetical protein
MHDDAELADARYKAIRTQVNLYVNIIFQSLASTPYYHNLLHSYSSLYIYIPSILTIIYFIHLNPTTPPDFVMNDILMAKKYIWRSSEHSNETIQEHLGLL